jgi:hypothetical protein
MLDTDVIEEPNTMGQMRKQLASYTYVNGIEAFACMDYMRPLRAA